ncbi:hypothetical protein HI914_00734 [Erysiphe necator]|nr:hypothetical protein HI914_00734 [Erysiphe necator]
MSHHGTLSKKDLCPQSKEFKRRKVCRQSKRKTKKTVRSASHWEWLYTSPGLNYEERLIVWLRGFEGLPWKDICRRYNAEMGLNVRIEKLQMKLNRLDKRLMKKYIEEEKKFSENCQPSFIRDLIVQNYNADNLLLGQVEMPPPLSLPGNESNTSQQFLSTENYCNDCFGPMGTMPTNLCSTEISTTNYVNLDPQVWIPQFYSSEWTFPLS